jgi:hypothetical protein
MAAAGLAGAEASGAPPTAPAVNAIKPWVPEPDMDCDWWVSREDGHSHRASIGQDDGLSMGLSDLGFDAWPETNQIRVELIFNHDPERRVSVIGWTTHISEAPTMLGFYLDAEARRALGGATRLELLRDGKTIVDMPLAATPSQAELDRCVPPPRTKDSDSED